MNVSFYILCRDLGGITGKAEWLVVSNMTLPGPRAECIMRVRFKAVQQVEASGPKHGGVLWSDYTEV